MRKKEVETKTGIYLAPKNEIGVKMNTVQDSTFTRAFRYRDIHSTILPFILFSRSQLQYAAQHMNFKTLLNRHTPKHKKETSIYRHLRFNFNISGGQRGTVTRLDCIRQV